MNREEQIRELFPLVRRIARRVQRVVPGSDIGDLVGDGSIGLIRAVDTYDPRRGPSLKLYAGKLIAGAMLNGMRRMDHVSERVRREIRQAEAERFGLANERGTLPSWTEMERLRPKLRRALTVAHRYIPLSLDGPLPPEEELTIDWAADPALSVLADGERRALWGAVSALPARQQQLLWMHYVEGASLHAIARQMAISSQRVSQLHRAALTRLRSLPDVAR